MGMREEPQSRYLFDGCMVYWNATKKSKPHFSLIGTLVAQSQVNFRFYVSSSLGPPKRVWEETKIVEGTFLNAASGLRWHLCACQYLNHPQVLLKCPLFSGSIKIFLQHHWDVCAPCVEGACGRVSATAGCVAMTFPTSSVRDFVLFICSFHTALCGCW